MSIDTNVRTSPPVLALVEFFRREYGAADGGDDTGALPAMLVAIGACGGFAAQHAVWLEFVTMQRRNPGDFLAFARDQSGRRYYLGDAINHFLFLTARNRLSFLSLAGSGVSDRSDVPDQIEVCRHVATTLGTDQFGIPRLPEGWQIHELPQAALGRCWTHVSSILRPLRPAEWPALMGAVAAKVLAPHAQRLGYAGPLKLLFESAVPMSRFDPTEVEGSGFSTPSFDDWSDRAIQQDAFQTITNEVCAVMPTMSQPGAEDGKQAQPPGAIAKPAIAFVNLAGPACAQMLADDQHAFGPMFGASQIATTSVVRCDVLILYCDIDQSGTLVGTTTMLSDVIRGSAARIVVIASDLPRDVVATNFENWTSAGGDRPINLVVTLARNGAALPQFFRALFQRMWNGVPMPTAWVDLAPQVPNAVAKRQRGPIARLVEWLGPGRQAAPEPEAPAMLATMSAGLITFGEKPRGR